MSVYKHYILSCTNCGIQLEEAGESITEVREFGRDNGWIFKKVQNGSYWDLCPKCKDKELR